MDNSKPAICVFCGSSHGADARYADAARDLGRTIAENGYNLIFGGGYVGLMGEVAHAARLAGAGVTGVLPEFLRHVEPPAETEEKIVITSDLFERKRLMLRAADAFIVLPGGLGTLDEFFEVMTSVQLDVFRKPVVLLDVGGYFDALEALLADIVRQGFARRSAAELYRRADSPGEAVEIVSRALGRAAKP
ncbi:MAG TPA: TIGR00730 family Rossman fold protein [Rhizomicrobium sp.]|nr:TIGR00730 family Rossman fold protein [Rhizomicrobium sp.]